MILWKISLGYGNEHPSAGKNMMPIIILETII